MNTDKCIIEFALNSTRNSSKNLRQLGLKFIERVKYVI